MTPLRSPGVNPTLEPTGHTGIAGVAEAKAVSPAKVRSAKETTADIKKAAAGFEAILVRQMLAASSVAGKGSYSDMGVEALATAVSSGGGLGLGNAIERAISAAQHARPADPAGPADPAATKSEKK